MPHSRTLRLTLSLLLGAMLVLASSPAPAEAQGVRPFFSNPVNRAIAGVWEGTIDFAALGSDRLEPVTFGFSLTGDAILVSEHEPTEIESATVGIWEHAGGGAYEIGIQAHRLGDGACAVIAAPDGSSGDDCILRIYSSVRFAGDGLLTGDLYLIFREVDATTGNVVEVVPPALSVELRKLTMEDFRQ